MDCDHDRGETGDDGGGKQRGDEARGIAAMSNLVGDRRRDWGHQRDGLRHIASGDEPGELRSGLATARNRRADTCRQSGSRDDRHDGAQHHKAQKDAAESRRRADAGGHAGSLTGHHTHDRLLSVAIQEASTAAEDSHAENEERPPAACRAPGCDEVTETDNGEPERKNLMGGEITAEPLSDLRQDQHGDREREHG